MAKRIAFKNFIDTITSFIRNDATIARQWNLKDRDGTLLDDTDMSELTDSIAGKIDSPSTPGEGDVLQYIGGVWTKRTLQELANDLEKYFINP